MQIIFHHRIYFLSNFSYIATQAPLPNTFEDFWRMIYEKNTNIIVMLAEDDEKETFIQCSIKAHRYWPKIGKEEKYGDFTVNNEIEIIYNDLFYNEFILTNNINDKKKEKYIFLNILDGLIWVFQKIQNL